MMTKSLLLFHRNTTFDKDITPYIHVFVYHAHYFVERFGSLKAFEMEAVEQLNYVNKLVFFGASNKGKENFTITEQVHFIHGNQLVINCTKDAVPPTKCTRTLMCMSVGCVTTPE